MNQSARIKPEKTKIDIKLIDFEVFKTATYLKSGLIIILLLNWFSLDIFSQIVTDSSHYVPLQKNLSQQWKVNLRTGERKVYKGKE